MAADGQDTHIARPGWHASPVDAVVQELDTSADGLRSEEAAARLEQHGRNELEQEEPKGALEILSTSSRAH